MSDNLPDGRKINIHRKNPYFNIKSFIILGILILACLLTVILLKVKFSPKDILFYDYNTNRIVVAEDIMAIDNTSIKFSRDDIRLEYYFAFKKGENIPDYDLTVDNDTIEWIRLDKERGVIVVKAKTPLVFEASLNEKQKTVYLTHTELKRKYDKIVILDAGHGGDDCGAIVNGVNEKDINIAVIKKVFDLLENSDTGIKPYLIRSEDETIEVTKRPFIGNDFADLYVSVHCDVYEPSNEPNGTQTHYNQFNDINTGRTKVVNGEFAEIMQRNIVEQLHSYDRGRTGDSEFFVVLHSTMPAVLIELGYMTNPDEFAKLTDESYQDLAAKGIYNGIVEAFEK